MGQIKFINLVTAGLFGATALAIIGCDTPQKSGQANATLRNDVTDVRPIEPVTTGYQPALYDTTAVVPTAPQMVTNEPVIASTTVSPSISSTPEMVVGGKSHKVQRGETLFSIARASYGDGKAWKKIVSANPGVSPSKLKVGQVLAMP